MIYTSDHEPLHVHVFKQGEIIINLGDAETPVSVRENKSMSTQNERQALIIVGKYQESLLEKWREIYG